LSRPAWTEANAVATVVQALALGRPDVGFFLRSEGRGSLTLPAAADLRERVSQVHGLSLARDLVSPLEMSFPTRHCLHVAVNGRVVDTDFFVPAIARA
jgi:DNA mismatch repair protein MutL